MRRPAAVLALSALCALLGCGGTQDADSAVGMYEVLLRGGTVVDGTGAPGRRADVALTGDRIVAIEATIAPARAVRIVDVTGLIVAPGFIDPHAHITNIAAHPDAENFLRQGITTIFNSLHSLDQPSPLGAFLDTLRVAPNTLWSAGHTWARREVMGRANRAPTAAELERMQALVEAAMDDGAFGFGTGLEYIPAVYAEVAELEALAKAAAQRSEDARVRAGALYVTHLRDEGSALLPAIDEALTVGRSAGLPVHISHLKSTGVANWHRTDSILARLERATASGTRTTFDVYPYTAYSTYSEVLFPSWVLADTPDSVRARLTDPVRLPRLRDTMRTLFLAQTGGTAASVRFRDIASSPEFAGRTLAEYLASRGRADSLGEIVDALITLQAAGGFTAVVEAMDPADVEVLLQHPAAIVSSDGDLVSPGVGFPHPRSYGAFPRVFAHYVRERGVLTLEDAVARMTTRPAQALGLEDRGAVKVGHVADLVVFDADRIGDKALFTDPHHYSDGVVHLFVNGVAVIDDGATTGARPGVPIRRQPSSP